MFNFKYDTFSMSKSVSLYDNPYYTYIVENCIMSIEIIYILILSPPRRVRQNKEFYNNRGFHQNIFFENLNHAVFL